MGVPFVGDNDSVNKNLETINNNFEKNIDMENLKRELKEKFKQYQTTIKFMAADAPIEILCLPAAIQKVLINEGFLRIYDLFDVDLIKIKGLGVIRTKQLATSLDQFFSMF